MAVVINEFEVVADPPPMVRGGGDSAPAAAAGGVSASDIERVIIKRRERQLRVWAH